MGERHIIRNKGVSHMGVCLQSDDQGNLTIQGDLKQENPPMLKLTEEEALALFENIGNMVQWNSNGITLDEL